MKVYLVWIGEYEDRGVIAIYSTRELAEKKLEEVKHKNRYVDSPEIEEWEVDE